MSEEEGTGEEGEEGTPSPDAWRATWAGDDEAKTKFIGRYASPTAAYDGLYSANLKIASGDYKKSEPFPDKGTDDEKTAWRTTNGIPEGADKYELPEHEGVSYGALAERAFESNMSPGAAKVAAEWHVEQKDKEREELTTSDEEARESSEDALRSEWGNEYRTNINKINGLLDTAPEGVKEDILGARLASGVPLGSDPSALKFLIDIALIKNPTTTIVPDGGNMIDSIQDEIASIESKMGTKEYVTSEKMQERYRELVRARDNIPK